jgi:hypothetical protein
MNRRKFSTCLNKEAKAYNQSVFGLISSAVLGGFLGLTKGMMWGLGGAAVGLVIGSMFSRSWHAGDIQRMLYWYLPWQKLWIDKNIPESHLRKLL